MGCHLGRAAQPSRRGRARLGARDGARDRGGGRRGRGGRGAGLAQGLRQRPALPHRGRVVACQ
eukprot:868603-Lingulodinium_polyedra.AAC.1